VEQTVEGPGPETSHRVRRAWRRIRARVYAVRRRVRRTPAGRIAWRVGVGLLGGVILVAGIIMIPGPGQGWATVFLGLAILSTEFSWARRLRHGLWVRLLAVRAWYAGHSPRVRAVLMTLLVVVGLATLLAVFWGSLAVTGLPSWLPERADDLLSRIPGVG
jgi:uncharacterized protein (TIGR02611 family)